MRRITAVFYPCRIRCGSFSPRGLFPSVWQTLRGALLKSLWIDAAGNFAGIFISSPSGPCPGVP
jgi:hypothetical protein